MRNRVRPFQAIVAALCLGTAMPSGAAWAQEEVITVRLSGQIAGGHLRRTVDANKPVRVMFEHLVPQQRQHYRIAVTRETMAGPAPLTTALGAKARVSEAADTNCRALRAAVAALNAATLEAEVAVALAALDAAPSALEASASCPELGATAAKLRALTTAYSDLGELRRGERATVVLTRPETNANSPMLSWTVVIETPPASGWITTVGLVSVPQVFMKEKEAYPKTSSSGTTTDVRDRSAEVASAPALVFAYSDRERVARGVSWSPFVGGVALNPERPTMFVGTGLVFRDAVVLTLGMAIHQQIAPRAQYETPGAPVDATLSTDQLNRTRTAVNPYFSISLRLDKNPFGG